MFRNLGMIAAAAALVLWAQSAARAAKPDHPAAPLPASSQPAPPAHADKAEGARTPPFHGLLAASEIDVKARLGAPDVARAEGKGAMWTYRLPDCALFVFFRSQQGQPLKMSGATAGPRVRGRSPPPVNECVAEALDRQGALAGRANP